MTVDSLLLNNSSVVIMEKYREKQLESLHIPLYTLFQALVFWISTSAISYRLTGGLPMVILEHVNYMIWHSRHDLTVG
jgi:hypothetical protein